MCAFEEGDISRVIFMQLKLDYNFRVRISILLPCRFLFFLSLFNCFSYTGIVLILYSDVFNNMVHLSSISKSNRISSYKYNKWSDSRYMYTLYHLNLLLIHWIFITLHIYSLTNNLFYHINYWLFVNMYSHGKFY